MICSKCGFQNSQASKMCEKCGNSLEEQQNQQIWNSANTFQENSQPINNIASPEQGQPANNQIVNGNLGFIPNTNPTVTEFNGVNFNSPATTDNVNINKEKKKNNRFLLFAVLVVFVVIIAASIIFLVPSTLKAEDYANCDKIIEEFKEVLYDIQYGNDYCNGNLNDKETATNCISTSESELKNADDKLKDLLKDKVIKNDKDAKAKADAIKDIYDEEKTKYNIDLDLIELIMPFRYIEQPGYSANIDEMISYFSDAKSELSKINVLKENENVKTKFLTIIDELIDLAKKYKSTEEYDAYSDFNVKANEFSDYLDEVTDIMTDYPFDNVIDKLDDLFEYILDKEYE